MRRNSYFKAVVAAMTIAFCAGSAIADEAGKAEYMTACAACHGAAGDGQGPMWDLLNVQVPDLRALKANNDGVFPMLDVIQIIDGRTGVRGHGGPMPIWGDRYSAQIAPKAGEYTAELVVRGRVLALATYLESIQQ